MTEFQRDSHETRFDHDLELARAFTRTAGAFERAPVQSDPLALERLVAFTAAPPNSLILDAGCGPGLVAEAFLEAGHRVVGIDLAEGMIGLARERCARFGDAAEFLVGSIHDDLPPGLQSFDVAVSRFVVHHVLEPRRFLARQRDLLRAGGILMCCDHTTDTDPFRAEWHNEVDIARDQTHTRNLSPGQLLDLLASLGLERLGMQEEPYLLDFEEWFARGHTTRTREEVLGQIVQGPGARGFTVVSPPGANVLIRSWRSLVRGIRPGLST